MLRVLLLCLCALLCVATHTLRAPAQTEWGRIALAASKVVPRSSAVMMAKKPAPKAAPKAAPKSASKSSSSAAGKGGIFPWVTNEPGTYAEVPKLADIQIRAMEKWVGGGANSITSNAFSVSKFLYPKNTRK